VPLAPLHEPHNLAPIRMALEMNSELPQVACFDTAFHRTAPEVEQAFALPYALYEEGVRRYGFHGLSYEYIASVLPRHAPEIAEGRVVVAHLDNGCSACAMQAGRSVATTMGFTALDGLPMGTRSGALDPGVVLYLIQQKGMSAEAVTDLLYRRSGMLGLSGVSSDFRGWPVRSRAPASRWMRSAIGRRARSPRSRPHLAGSTGSSSPPASARTPRRSAPQSAGPAIGSGSSWTRPPTARTGPASRRTPAGSASMSSRPTKT
jgi:acetate kinase